MEKKLKAHVVISGKVQGVFFRLETQRAAKSRNLTGWVKNMLEGSVESVFEGDEDKVESMIDWCRKGSSLSRVISVDVKREEYTGEFENFEITY
jgi:acylphosphatase